MVFNITAILEFPKLIRSKGNESKLVHKAEWGGSRHTLRVAGWR